jgi:hypothetical protein
VPNLDELLKPANARVKKFLVGSREYDVQKFGLRTDIGEFEFDTASNAANSNAGHEYNGRIFSEDERRALIEYVKSL